MQTDMTRTYPVPLKKGFDYADDFKTWPDWYVGMAEILEPEKGAWRAAGDEVRFAYKLLGRRLEGKAILDEYRETELVKFHTEVPGLPVVYFEYHYREAGEAAFVLKVIMETEEPTSFFGKAIDRMLLPVALERDLRHSLENLDTIFTADLI
jgi:hypothetical protein